PPPLRLRTSPARASSTPLSATSFTVRPSDARSVPALSAPAASCRHAFASVSVLNVLRIRRCERPSHRLTWNDGEQLHRPPSSLLLHERAWRSAIPSARALMAAFSFRFRLALRGYGVKVSAMTARTRRTALLRRPSRSHAIQTPLQ